MPLPSAATMPLGGHCTRPRRGPQRPVEGGGVAARGHAKSMTPGSHFFRGGGLSRHDPARNPASVAGPSLGLLGQRESGEEVRREGDHDDEQAYAYSAGQAVLRGVQVHSGAIIHQQRCEDITALGKALECAGLHRTPGSTAAHSRCGTTRDSGTARVLGSGTYARSGIPGRRADQFLDGGTHPSCLHDPHGLKPW